MFCLTNVTDFKSYVFLPNCARPTVDRCLQTHGKIQPAESPLLLDLVGSPNSSLRPFHPPSQGFSLKIPRIKSRSL